MNETKTKTAEMLNEISEIENKHDTNETNEFELSEMNQQQIDTFKNQIVSLDNQSVMNYGREQQQQLSQYSDRMLQEVQKEDVKDIGKTLDKLMNQLNESDPDKLLPENQNFITKMFNRTKSAIEKQFAHLTSVSAKIDTVSRELTTNRQTLLRDIQSLETLYEHNQAYFKEVSALIEAGELRLDELRKNELQQLKDKASQTGAQEDIQAVADMEDFIERLDKRVYDLQLSRDVALQSAPQIRMVQNINQSLAEKVQSSILTSIPVWKNQMAIALALANQRQVSRSQKLVNDTTNNMIKKNSEMLKENAIHTAKENERGVIDVESLEESQANIKEAIQKTLEIKEQGQAKRKEAKAKLKDLEKQLHTQQLQSNEAIEHHS